MNPYINRAAIRHPEKFYGRNIEIGRIYSRINVSDPQSISIVGDRRIGKSSILHFIYHEDNRTKYLSNPESYMFALMDLQEEPNDTISEFIESLLTLISAELGRDIPMTGKTGYDTLKRFAMELRREKRKLIILFDEFELITQNESFDSSFYAFFRGLASNYDIAFITSSMRDLQELCRVKAIANSPFFNIFSKVHLGPFRYKEAIELIEKPSSSAGHPLSEYADAILDISGMLPIFIQIACSAFFEFIQTTGKNNVSSEDIEEIENIFFDEASSHFQYIWDSFDDDAKDMCRDVLFQKEIDDDRKNVLIDLTKRGYIIEKDNVYKIFSSTFTKRIIGKESSKDNHQASIPTIDNSARRVNEAIMVVDICGHSSAIQKLGGDGIAEIIGELDTIVRDTSGKYNCQYIAGRGDGYLVTFPSADNAVSVAFAILEKMKERNQKIDEAKKIHIRFAINYGETIVSPSGERIGERVNETFRMESLRVEDQSNWDKGNEKMPERDYILASERVYDELRNSEKMNFRLMGIFELRGLPGLHRVYELTLQTQRVKIRNK
jgi:class 3 adenylate cyclase/AAA+ ATPase superfamily predicted ATPase